MTQSLWVARDRDNFLTLFKGKPERFKDAWVDFNPDTEKQFILIDETLFPDLKWRDEPLEVNIFTKDFIQKFGDACYKQGQNQQ